MHTPCAYTECQAFAVILTCSPNKLTSFSRTLWVFIKSTAKAAAMTPTAAPAEVTVSTMYYEAQQELHAMALRSIQRVEQVLPCKHVG